MENISLEINTTKAGLLTILLISIQVPVEVVMEGSSCAGAGF
jgi:hypothetical protein